MLMALKVMVISHGEELQINTGMSPSVFFFILIKNDIQSGISPKLRIHL